MKLLSTIKREARIREFTKKGYARSFAQRWTKKKIADAANYKKKFSKASIERLHEEGYLCRSAASHGYSDNGYKRYLSDFDYSFLYPFNNSFSKWLQDLQTTAMVLKPFDHHCPKVLFSLVPRDGDVLMLDKREISSSRLSVDSLLKGVEEMKTVELRPARWISSGKRYRIDCRLGQLLVNGRFCNDFSDLVRSLEEEYVITEYVDQTLETNLGVSFRHYIRCWLANDDEKAGGSASLLYAELAVQEGSGRWSYAKVDIDDGSYEWGSGSLPIPRWELIKSILLKCAEKLSQLNYFYVDIALSEDSLFKFVKFSEDPAQPVSGMTDDFLEYLENKVSQKRENGLLSPCEQRKAFRKAVETKVIMKFARKGIRPYMQRLWVSEVKDDLLHTKGISLGKKIECWKHGFKSFRTWQYGLTGSNWNSFLSDYDYHWLNRINNCYQVWVNDKTTFKIALEPFNDFTPAYYFSVFRRGGKTIIEKMKDCPDDIEESASGICDLLKREKLLVFKMSAGTHGDGFYRLEYTEESGFLKNGSPVTQEDLESLFLSQVSYYVVTEFVQMHPQLKRIYPMSVNTIRVMVVNRHGDDPEIMQTYFRIGSSSTGFTDNVAYGGVCAMVDAETGRIYSPETLKDHYYHDCPVHPDTGVEIGGIVPNWGLIKTTICSMCRYLAELEYLGFDVAVTEKGFQILEINIHQDLHKVHSFSPELNRFFQDKIAEKKKRIKEGR